MFTLALKLNSRRHLSSKRPPISHYIMVFVSTHKSTRLYNLLAFFFNVNEMTSLSSAVTSKANKHHGKDESTSQVKYTFQGKSLKCQTNHLLMNLVEYFEKEAKKSKGHLNVLKRVSKATGKIVCVV